jgi:hypothetical protein
MIQRRFSKFLESHQHVNASTFYRRYKQYKLAKVNNDEQVIITVGDDRRKYNRRHFNDDEEKQLIDNINATIAAGLPVNHSTVQSLAISFENQLRPHQTRSCKFKASDRFVQSLKQRHSFTSVRLVN